MGYKLVEIKTQSKIFEVFIKADANDGDDMSTLTIYTEEEFNVKIVEDLILLQSKYSEPHLLECFNNGVYDRYERDTVLDIPYSDLDCTETCHTLMELRVICTDTDGKVYNVIFNSVD